MAKRCTRVKRSRKKLTTRPVTSVYYYTGSDPRTKSISCMNPNCVNKQNKKRSNKERQSIDHFMGCPGGCETFYFCSTVCTKLNKEHVFCHDLKKLRSDVKVLGQNVDVMMTLADIKSVGDISPRRTPAAFAFIRARFNLASLLTDIARLYHLTLHWDEALSIMQENLRLSHLHLHVRPIKAWCYQFVTCLLDAGRLDDVLSFSSYLIKRFLLSPSSSADDLYKRSHEGVWMYPRSDIEICNKSEWQQGDLYLVFVKFIAKLKQISSFDLVKNMLCIFQKTKCFRYVEGLEGPLGVILEYLIPCQVRTVFTIESFNGLCDDLVLEITCMWKILLDRNPYFAEGMTARKIQELSCLIQSTGLDWRYPSDSKPFAYSCIENCRYSLLSIPHLDLWIKQCSIQE